jgi:hypothetical protein
MMSHKLNIADVVRGSKTRMGEGWDLLLLLADVTGLQTAVREHGEKLKYNAVEKQTLIDAISTRCAASSCLFVERRQ